VFKKRLICNGSYLVTAIVIALDVHECIEVSTITKDLSQTEKT